MERVEINTLLYADDLVLMSKSAKGLQCALEVLQQFCFKWKLTVNMDKTKIMVFLAKKCEHTFYLDNQEIKPCKSYTYLGIVFTPSEKFNSAKKSLFTKARKGLAGVRAHFNHFNGTDVNSLLKLFDSVISPITMYGSEVWCLADTAVLKHNLVNFLLGNQTSLSEKLHTHYCKQTLGIHKKAMNAPSLAELGRYPLVIQMLMRTCEFILKIRMKSNTLANSVLLHTLPHNSLICNLFQVLNELDMLKSFLSVNVLEDINNFSARLQTKLQEYYINIYRKNIQETKSRLDVYKSINHLNTKEIYKKEHYLTLIKTPKWRSAITKLRISAHQLPIEAGRFNNTPRHLRLCQLCNSGSVGDEMHALFNCSNPIIIGLRTHLENIEKCSDFSRFTIVQQFN